MAELSKNVSVSETERLTTMQKKENPRDFLQRFSTTQLRTHQEKKNEKLDINLGLALSLGGIYSCENSNEKPSLSRSSSIIGMMTLNKDDDDDNKGDDTSLPKSFLSLSRSCSLPTEAEQEQRKAALMALARRRSESTDSFMRFHEQEKYLAKEAIPSSPSKVAAWAAASAAKSPALCRALVQIKRRASVHSSRKIEGQEGSVAVNDATHSQSFPTRRVPEPNLMLGANANGKLFKVAEIMLQNQSKRAKLVNNCFEDRGMDVMKQMPSVTTTGDGPNGRRIEGFLYKYRKGQVSIVCVCHGSFLSPAEFVRHAGGTDLANPMKHITVCSFAF